MGRKSLSEYRKSRMEKNNFIIAYMDFVAQCYPNTPIHQAIRDSGYLWRCMHDGSLPKEVVPVVEGGSMLVFDHMAETEAKIHAGVIKGLMEENPELSLSGKPAPIPRDHGAICLSDSIGHLPIETPDREAITIEMSNDAFFVGTHEGVKVLTDIRDKEIGGFRLPDPRHEGAANTEKHSILGALPTDIKKVDALMDSFKKFDKIRDEQSANKFSEKETKPKRIGRPPAEGLTTDQRVILRKICDRNDLGKPVSIAELSDILGIASMDYKIKGIEDRGYIFKHKEGLRKVTLIPLKREDGSDYTAPIKENGITKLPPAPGLSVNLDTLGAGK